MTELIWEGKYRETPQGRQKVAPVRIALPFQTIETVNESAQDRQRSLELFAAGRETEWRNRLIWGDKKYVLPSLLPEFAGKVNLIYIDPPFDTGQNFSFTATIPDHPDSSEDETTPFVKQPSILEQKAYRDTWGRGLDTYLGWIYEAMVLLRELLAEDGSLFVHIDWRVGPYVRTLLDEVFGAEQFVNEIIWQHQIMGGAHGRRFPKAHEMLLWCGKTDRYFFGTDNPNVRVPYSKYIQESLEKDESGRW